MSTIYIFAMAAINIPFIAEDPTRWYNWVALIICFGLGIATAIYHR